MHAADAATLIATIVWRRLDADGSDRCRLEQTGNGWRVAGEATFTDRGATARLAYLVWCDRQWQTIGGAVTGEIGSRQFDVEIRRTAAGWTMNGTPAAAASDCVDLDLGFTPATNLLQLRRLALPIGAAADAPVAWLDVDSRHLDRVHQRYERRTAETYWYESPSFGYAALLEVRRDGFITRYPDLWAAFDE